MTVFDINLVDANSNVNGQVQDTGNENNERLRPKKPEVNCNVIVKRCLKLTEKRQF